MSLATVQHGAEFAARYHKPFVLNPAPAMQLPESLLALCTLMGPNEYELGTVFAQPDAPWEELLTRMPGRVIVTKGAAEGAYAADAMGALRHQPAYPATPSTPPEPATHSTARWAHSGIEAWRKG